MWGIGPFCRTRYRNRAIVSDEAWLMFAGLRQWHIRLNRISCEIYVLTKTLVLAAGLILTVNITIQNRLLFLVFTWKWNQLKALCTRGFLLLRQPRYLHLLLLQTHSGLGLSSFCLCRVQEQSVSGSGIYLTFSKGVPQTLKQQAPHK